MQEKLLQRFLRYVAVPSQSNAANANVPSSEGQRKLAELLKQDLAELGLVDLEISEYSVLTGKLPAYLPEGCTKEVPAVGWCAHLDTIDINMSPEIHPQVVKNYQGGDVCLNKEKDIWIRTAEHTELEKYVGEDIVFTDGTSVLGADNKAAIANIMVALETIVNEKRYHGDIYVAFVPDEEIGLRGSKKMDFSKFPVKFAYTIDCCELGEVVYQTFNAGTAIVKIKGVSAHPMSAKGVLINPTLLAVDLVNMFDRTQTPECTEGIEGYIWVKSIVSNDTYATVTLDIRDHNKKRYEERKVEIAANAEKLQAMYPRAEVTCTMSDTYGNINDAVTEDNKYCIDYLYTAMEKLGIKPITLAMRGGTDGSFISTKGILTPNYFTAGHNFHSNCEFLPLGAMEKSCKLTLELVDLIYNK